jgi:hypothetical protein
MGPSDRKLKPAVLEQTYVGKGASDVSDKSEKSKLLVGESDQAYALHPITDDGIERATDTITVVQLKIKSTPS